jgi:hypothetical protein
LIEDAEPDAIKELETKLFDSGCSLKVKEAILE